MDTYENPIKFCVFGGSIICTGICIYFLVKIYRSKHLKETLHSDMFAFDKLIHKSVREMCDTSLDFTERFVWINQFNNERPSHFRFWTNLLNMAILHTFHSIVFIYFFMLTALIIHKKIIQSTAIKKLFALNEQTEKKYSLIIRRETQERLSRLETKLFGAYFTFCAFLVLMFCGFMCCQIIDLIAFYNDNVYQIYNIVCNVSKNLKYFMYFTYSTIGIIEIIATFYLNYEILKILRNNLVRAHQLFKWNIKICMILCILSVLFHVIYVIPTSSDRYGLLEISFIGERSGWEFFSFIGSCLSFAFCIYFICNLRFHLIYTNLDNINELLVSRFCKIPDKYYSISSFNLFDTAQDYFKKGSIGSNKGSSLCESEYDEPLNISDKSNAGIFDDRKDFKQLRLLEKRRATEISSNSQS